MTAALQDAATSRPTTGAARPVMSHGAPRRRLGGVSRESVLNVVGAAVSGVSIALLLFGRLAPFSGVLGFVVVAYIAFLATFALLVSLVDDLPAVRDKLMTVLLYTAAIVMFGSLVLVVLYTVGKGASPLAHANFLTRDMKSTGPLDPLTRGGVEHAVVGTLWIMSIALIITVPLGIGGAVYLNEVGGRVSRFVRTVVDAMTALPSIVAGLFVYATWILILHKEKSGLAAALAISVMMLPIIIRAAEVVLRLVPGNLREASAALGAPQWRTVWHVVLPTARSGLTTSVILGMARGIGETAPVLLVAGFTSVLNTNPFHGPMVALPLVAFEFVQSPQRQMIARGFGTAAFLMILVVALFIIARVIGGRGPGHVSPRHARRIRRQSARDVARFDARSELPIPEVIADGAS
jgi:phosphate transport system permease protein